MKAKPALLLILILAFSLRAHPLALDSFVGPDPYFHARLSQETLENGYLPKYDELSMQGRPYSYAPIFHTLFAAFSAFTGLPIALLVRLLPALYGAAAALLAFVMGRKFFTEQAGLFAALALSIMPMHLVRTASYARPDGLSLLVVPAVIYLAYRGKYGAAALLCIFMALLHPLSSLYLFAALLAFAALSKLGKINSLPQLSPKKILACVSLGTLAWLVWLASRPFSPLEYISPISFESAELRAFSLQSILLLFTFSWLFVLIALPKLKHNFLLAWFSVSVAFALIGTRLGIFLTMPVALIAGFGINTAIENSGKHAKYILFLIFVLALLTALPNLAKQGKYASLEERSAMLWIAGNSGEKASMAAQWDQGHPLAYYTNRKVVIDGYFEFAPDLAARNRAVRELIYTSDCAKIRENTSLYSMAYFYVPAKAMASDAYLNGIFEAKNCEIMSSLYASDRTRIFGYSG